MKTNQLLTKVFASAMFAGMMLFGSSVFAQVKIGTNPATIDAANNLEVESTAGNKVSVNKTTGKVTIADGSQGTGKVLTSDANGVATWQASTSSSVFIGTVDAGDINQFNTSASIPVSGYITSAGRYSSITGPGGQLFSVISVQFPSLGTTNYVANVTLESITNLGGGFNVSVVTPPVITLKTETGFNVYIRENAQQGQDIRLNIMIAK